MEGDKKEAAAETVEKAAEPVEAVTAKDQAEEAVAKKKATTGLYFSDIPKDVRVSEFKNVLRERDVKLVFVKWKAFKQSAIVFFEDELEVVTKNLEGLALQGEPVKFEEVVPRAGGREPAKRPPRARKERVEREEGGRRRPEVRDVEAEKARKRTNRKEQRMKRREEFGGKFGIFVGRIPRGVTREALGEEFAKLDLPLPDYVDWVVKKGHAFLFWQEADAKLSLEVFSGITVGGVALQVELYDTNRPKREDRPRREDREEEEGTPAAAKKADSDADKKTARKPRKSESEKEPKLNGKESHSDKKSDEAKKSKPDSETKTKSATTPKKTDSPKSKETIDAKEPKTPTKTNSATKKPPTTPKTPETKTKSPKVNGSAPKSPSKDAKAAPSKTSPSKAGGAPSEGGKENCSIS